MFRLLLLFLALLILTGAYSGCSNLNAEYEDFIDEGELSVEEDAETDSSLDAVMLDIIILAVDLLLLVWILFLNGAEWLEGSFLSTFLISHLAPRWSAEGIRLYAGLVLSAYGVYKVYVIFREVL